MFKGVLFGFLLITSLNVVPCACLPRKAAVLPSDVSIVLTECKQLISECKNCKALDPAQKKKLLWLVQGAENEIWRIAPQIPAKAIPEVAHLFNSLNEHEEKLRKKVYTIHA